MMVKGQTTGAERTPSAQTGSEWSLTPNTPNTPNTHRELIAPSSAESNAEAYRRGAAHIIRRQLIHRFGQLPEKNERQLCSAPLEQLEALGLRTVTAGKLQSVFADTDDLAGRPPVSRATGRYARLAKEGGWVVTGQIAAISGSLVLVRLLTERMTPGEYGQLALGLTVAGLVNQTVMGGVNNGISRFYSIAAEKRDVAGYLRACRQMMYFATLAAATIGLALLGGLLYLGYMQWTVLAAAALFLSIMSGYNSSLSGIQNAARQRSIVAFHSGLDAWLKIVLVLGMLSWLGCSSTAVVLGYALSALLVTGSQSLFLRRLIPEQRAQDSSSTPWLREMWAYCWPFSTWGIFSWTQQSSDRWALEQFATVQDVGLYAVLFQLGYIPITIATGLAATLVGPILYQRSGDARDHSRNVDVQRIAWRVVLSCLLLTLLAFFLTLALHETIFRWLVAKQYRSMSYLLPWVILAGGLFASGQMLALKMMSDMRSASLLVAKIVTAVLGIVFNIYGACTSGIRGVTSAAVAFSALYLLWITLLSIRPSCGISEISVRSWRP